MQKFWHYWAKALGENASNSDVDADIVAAIVAVYVITNFVIIAGLIHHW